MSAQDIIETEVRDIVRRQSLDPLTEHAAVRRIVADVVDRYDERSLIVDLPVVEEPDELSSEVFNAVAGYGVLQRYLDDPSVEEIWINEPSRVFIARNGRSELTTTVLTADEVRDLVERMLKTTGRRIDFSTPFVDAMLPDGSRLHVAIPDITRTHWAVNVRKFVVRATYLEDLVAFGTLTHQAARFLEAAVHAGLNVLVAGGTQAGKTTLLNCLASAVPASERVVSCEEVFELKIKLPDWVAMQTRQANLEGTGELRLRHLVKEALRMRPSRIIVGEVRAEECLDLLIALNSGLPWCVKAQCRCDGAKRGDLLPDQSGPGRRRAGCGPSTRRLRSARPQARVADRRDPHRQRPQRVQRQAAARIRRLAR